MNETKFDGMGKVYSKFRPSYPLEFLEYLYHSKVLEKGSIIADIGAGTGILTKQLLEQGNMVYAVEPNADMLGECQAYLSEFNKVKFVNMPAENTGLDNNSVDAITVAQAFHWFDRVKFKEECGRILKPSGKIVLVWNSRDENSELVKENDEINRVYCPNFKGFSGGMRGTVDEGEFDGFFTGEFVSKVIKNDICFDEDGFIGRNLSASYALKNDETGYNEYLTALKTIFNKYSNGEGKGKWVVMPNFTRFYIGRV